jgi:hypothetical protein
MQDNIEKRIEHETKGHDMTDEEADALDVYFTNHLPKTDPTKGGVTTRQGFRMVALDKLSEEYLLTMALASRKSPTELIGELVREKVAAAAEV